ncbi:hypothetical protein [Pedobacter gandavensis]|uniref:hypothetical protein n=1 Tax=Pedobacter gandavensis TaxID=2679963 RepID=UPI00292EA71F|nr:hypothetical protein [Pedobacter gandavensis]
MKLTLKISAAIILLLLISVYGYLQFRDSRSYEGQIAKNAQVVYKLNVDALMKTMAADFISNPGYYMKSKGQGGERPDFSLPANLFAYSLKTNEPGTVFSCMTLSDSTGLNAYLKRALKITDFTKFSEEVTASSTDKGRILGISADRKLTVLYNEKAIAIAFSLKKENVMKELNDILDQKNRMESSDPLMIAVKKAEGHLSWIADGFSGRLDFKDGRAEMQGNFPIAGLKIPAQPQSLVKFSDRALIKAWVNAGLSDQASKSGKAESGTFKWSGRFKEQTLKGITIQPDSLLKSYHGFAALEMGPGITQMDSLVAYEYNDDFEKVATVQLKKVTVPHFRISVAAQTKTLMEYLKAKQVLLQGHRLNKEVFPLYQVFSQNNGLIWQLSTLEDDVITLEKPKSGSSAPKAEHADFFSLTADLKGIKAQQLFPLLNTWIKPFSHLKITAAKIDERTGRVSGILKFENKNLNAFIQLIR